jgi:hypothetical protein
LLYHFFPKSAAYFTLNIETPTSGVSTSPFWVDIVGSCLVRCGVMPDTAVGTGAHHWRRLHLLEGQNRFLSCEAPLPAVSACALLLWLNFSDSNSCDRFLLDSVLETALRSTFTSFFIWWYGSPWGGLRLRQGSWLISSVSWCIPSA